MVKITNAITELLISHNFVEKSDAENCSYGLRMFFSTLGEIMLMLLIAALCKRFVEIIIYLCAFLPVRVYGGGYHADSRPRCFVITMTIFVLVIIALWLVPLNIYGYLIIISALLSVVIVLKFAPIVHKNKSLTQKEIQVFKSFARITIFADALISVVSLLIFGSNVYIFSIALAELSIAFSIIAAKLKQRGEGVLNEKV